MTPKQRNDRAREWRAKQDAVHKQKLAEAKRMMPMIQGDPQSVTGRIALPGELPGIAAIGSSDHVLGLEESQELTRVPSIFE